MFPSDDLTKELESYLGFLIDHELEESYANAPLNRTLSENKSPNPRAAAAVTQIRVTPVASGPQGGAVNALKPQNLTGLDIGTVLHEAKQRAAAARSLDELYAELEAFQHMPMRHEGATQLVRFRGSDTPDLIVVGECPDAEEDLSGQAFAGKPGALIDAALQAAGVKDRALLTPCVFWRPAGGRPLMAEDISLTTPFMQALIRLASPKAILLLGAGAVSVVLNLDQRLSELRGRVVGYHGDPNVPSMASYPASFLLKQPLAKGLFWRDLLQLTVQAEL
ncbi:uracil-DNA glycosylase [Asticcacaulis sp. AC402]|uniref:uracil-DNA glycosylase n=1 Tax=Asticcacaulis sp. AC402 TaxID=1282361 RepID=UPI0003C3D31F|nr:uracil-DNA glycosylase [Asticcacaulis sp. AC402]ESQ76422.1 hypothetical protein ABAC402_04800 [Asticcacaulis sp. AC402]